MSHARLTHPTRPTLTFRQTQADEDAQNAVGNVAPQLGTDNPPLVHIETKERERTLRGRVTGPRRAQQDSDTDDWMQALANYIDRLEGHVTEFQGDGYTLIDTQRGTSLNTILHSIEWTLVPGAPYEVQFDANLSVGKGAMDSRSINRRNPTVNDSMDVVGRVGGIDLPGLRQFQVSRSFGVEVSPVYYRGSAENNDVVASEGVRQEIVFEGTHSGSREEREAADAELDALVGRDVVFETRFPGYELEGVVMGYDSNFEARMGPRQHHFTLRFIEGERA